MFFDDTFPHRVDRSALADSSVLGDSPRRPVDRGGVEFEQPTQFENYINTY